MPTTSHAKNRPDQNGNEEGIYRKNKKILLKTAEICAICGGYIDKSIKFPDPRSASIDHIIPVCKGGKSTMNNLQVTHLGCNMEKGRKVYSAKSVASTPAQGNGKNLPQYFDWSLF